MSNEAEVAAFEASLAAEEAARWAPEPEPAVKAADTASKAAEKAVQADPVQTATDPAEPDPNAASDAAEPVDDAEAKALAAAEAEEASVAERIKRSHIEAREAKKRAKLLEQELAVLRGTRTESRDETVQREAEQLAQRLSSEKLFNDECSKIAATGQKEFKDFSESLGHLWEAVGGFNPALVEASIEAGDAHKTLRWLGQNPDEAERIVNLPPARQGAAIARIAQQVSTPKVKPVSKMPPPIQPVSGGSTGGEVSAPDLEKMSMEQLAKHWDAEDRKRRAARFG